MLTRSHLGFLSCMKQNLEVTSQHALPTGVLSALHGEMPAWSGRPCREPLDPCSAWAVVPVRVSTWAYGDRVRWIGLLCAPKPREMHWQMEVILRARWRCSNLVLSQMDRAGTPSQATQCFLSLPRTMNRQLEKIMDFCNSVSHYSESGKEKSQMTSL